LLLHGILKEKGNKREKGKLKSHGRYEFPGMSKSICWNCDKVKISKDTTRKRKRRIRKKIMIPMMSLKNLLRRMVDMLLLQP
jgi:hypothetical protein